MNKTHPEVLDHIAQILFDKKGQNIIALDLREVSQMTDFFLIVEGSVDRHVKALAQYVLEVCESYGHKPWHTEGLEMGDWIVLDFGDMMIHLLIPELREKYALEEIWREATIVDLRIQVPEKKGNIE